LRGFGNALDHSPEISAREGGQALIAQCFGDHFQRSTCRRSLVNR
jgi:hypothetical protein